MKRYDVTIVGAGPAGSTAAYYLSRAGVKVGLVDKQTFPRDKVCGDGAVMSILTRLERMGLSKWLEQNSFNAPGELLFSAPNGQALRFAPDDHDVCYGRVIPRLELDEAIAGRAVEMGADLLEGVHLTGMARTSPDAIRVSGTHRGDAPDLQVESKLLITADGAHASFTRYLGLVKSEPDLVAVRTYFENVGGSESLLEIHYDADLSPGYAWIFPLKHGRANVGLGTYVNRSRQRQVNLKQTLQQFISHNRYAGERLRQARMMGPLKGYPLRARMDSVIPVDDNILVVGEAAGLVNPLNGEGIGTAMLSGELAARHVQKALELGDFSRVQLSAYATALRRQIGHTHFIARVIRGLLAVPGVVNRTVRRARRDRAFAQMLFEVIIEMKPPRAVFSPEFLVKLVAG